MEPQPSDTTNEVQQPDDAAGGADQDSGEAMLRRFGSGPDPALRILIGMWLSVYPTITIRIGLLVGGTVVGGTLVPQRVYFDKLVEMYRQWLSEAAARGGLRIETWEDIAALFGKPSDALEPLAGEYVHLQDAKVLGANGQEINIGIWRGRLEMVSGWFHSQPPTPEPTT